MAQSAGPLASPVVLTPPTEDPVFDDWSAWYDAVLSQWVVQDPDANSGWCPGWRDHPLAAAAVDALWRAWEVANLDPGPAVATFMAHQCFPIMRELLDGGTFAGCRPGLHRPTAVPLPA